MASYDYPTELALPGWYQGDNRYETPDPGTPYEIQALDYFTVNTNTSFSAPQPTSDYSSSDQYILNLLLSQPKSTPNATSKHPFQSGSATRTESTGKEPIHSLSVTADKVPSPGGHSNSSTGDDNDIDNIKNENSGSGLADVKLRSASRKPKRPRKKPAPSLQARECHNEVEKQYRTRLKLRFENLLAVLKASRTNNDDLRGASATEVGYVLSRGEVLDAATHRILALEKENVRLSSRVKQLTNGAANYYGIRHMLCNPGSTRSRLLQSCYFIIIITMALRLHLQQRLNLLRQQEQLEQLPLKPDPSQELPRARSPPAESTHYLGHDCRLQDRIPGDAGYACTEIASQLKITKRQAQWAIRAPSATPRRRSGRPSLPIVAQVDELITFVCSSKAARRMSYQRLPQALGWSCSWYAIRHALGRAGFKRYVARRKRPVTAANQQHTVPIVDGLLRLYQGTKFY
ncbi:hypothetical protein FACUT_12931 [Fusarium acutatum]|uniref:BHLH domain-containing protein n=1 Tax=Fusarium acutatum TaxID=78861 RepID=A0A8H4JCS4_9HYPO|nr:hypothetical protein FACUT_12931 [Fusarium acutatum]